MTASRSLFSSMPWRTACHAFSWPRCWSGPRSRDCEKRRSTSMPCCWAPARPFDALATREKKRSRARANTKKLPSPISSGDPESVSKLLSLARQFRAIDGSGEGLSAIDLDRVDTTPLPVRAARHVGDHEWVWRWGSAVAVFNAGDGTGRDVVEARGNDIARHDPFAAAAATRERILLQLHKRATDRPARVDEAGISPTSP